MARQEPRPTKLSDRLNSRTRFIHHPSMIRTLRVGDNSRSGALSNEVHNKFDLRFTWLHPSETMLVIKMILLKLAVAVGFGLAIYAL